MDLVLLHPQPDTLTYHPDTNQTPPDTIQTTPDIGNFMQVKSTGQKTISEYHGFIYFLPTSFGVITSPDTLRHQPQTLDPYIPIYRLSYAIEGVNLI